ncbi:hypothetical protein UFOVP1290_557 [uncultured Caudovirales phage]|uniref:Uncharacterized protein n=1 Tax=uncultured Caudovirales phage TaxID=2100421 RepID=A0A6J5RRX7_9CAUD|nr:hypothetical protein UFOVP1290_557 [uncultured Caudovirales phage]
MSNNVKLYKNSERNKPENYKEYVPQYKLRGIQPEDFKSSVVVSSNQMLDKQTSDNPRMRAPGTRQPYAEVVQSPIGKGPVPNVGNNMEHAWSGVDNSVFDDVFQDIDPSHPMIDNNDYVSDEALGVNEEKQMKFHKEEDTLDVVPSSLKEISAKDTDSLISILENSIDNEYILLIHGTPLYAGSLNEVQEQCKLFVFGQHELCNGKPISVTDVIVIKRVPIKIGLFLE